MLAASGQVKKISRASRAGGTTQAEAHRLDALPMHTTAGALHPFPWHTVITPATSQGYTRALDKTGHSFWCLQEAH